MTDDIAKIARGLTKAEREAVLRCEADGNGAHIWSVFPLVRQGLMGLVPVPRLQGVRAYRLSEAGIQVRDYLKEMKDDL